MDIQKLLGKEAESLLGDFTPKIAKNSLILPSSSFIDESF